MRSTALQAAEMALSQSGWTVTDAGEPKASVRWASLAQVGQEGAKYMKPS